MSYRSYVPSSLDKKDLHQLIIGAVSPRPIAFVSSINAKGQSNLAPYSFFNAISSNPPLLVFSISNIKARDNKLSKDTLTNLKEVPQCTINVVNHNIHRQMSLCSVAFPYGTSEFEKSGLKMLPSELVKAPRVADSPVQFECTVDNIIEFGKQEGAANLVVCSIKKIHIKTDTMMKDKVRIDTQKLDAVGRLGRSNYVSVKGKQVFSAYQPVYASCLGYDKLPLSIRESKTLFQNEIALIASCGKLPSMGSVKSYVDNYQVKLGQDLAFYHSIAAVLLRQNKKEEALIWCMIPEYNNSF